MAESGSVAGLVAKWRDESDSLTRSGESGDLIFATCAYELEAALAKDELRVAAVELCKQLLQDNAPAPLVSSRALARRVLRLAGEA